MACVRGVRGVCEEFVYGWGGRERGVRVVREGCVRVVCELFVRGPCECLLSHLSIHNRRGYGQ